MFMTIFKLKTMVFDRSRLSLDYNVQSLTVRYKIACIPPNILIIKDMPFSTRVNCKPI